jgi:hypothetical protein
MKKLLKIRISILLAILLLSPCANATANSNSITGYGIEYYMQTDKTVYDLGENVEMLFTATNLRDETVSIYCTQSNAFDLGVEENNEIIWSFVYFSYPMIIEVVFLPGESKGISAVWDMKDNNGNLVGPGTYDAIGWMNNAPWNYENGGTYTGTVVSVPVTITPEPSSLFLFMACLPILMRTKRTKHI